MLFLVAASNGWSGPQTRLRAVSYSVLLAGAITIVLAGAVVEHPAVLTATLIGFALAVSSTALLGVLHAPRPKPSSVAQAYGRHVLSRVASECSIKDGANTIWAYAVEPDKELFVASDGSGVVAYGVCAGVALAAGDPICEPGRRLQVLAEFSEYCRGLGYVPALYQVLAADVDTYRGTGMRAIKIGEEAVIDVPGFSLAGKKIANVRHCVTHVEREGLTAEVHIDGVRDERTYRELEAVSCAWLASRKGRGEMGFSMGAFGPQEICSGCVVIGRDPAGRARAFVTFRRVPGSKHLVLDLMRREPGAPSGAVDFLIAKALEQFRDQGVEGASLSLAPLAGTVVEGRTPAVERMLSLLFTKGDAVYRYRSLFNFKKKFAPRWESRYLVTPPGIASIARSLLAVALVHMPKQSWKLPSHAAIVDAAKVTIWQSVHWRSGLTAHELAKNLRLMWIITFVLSLPELKVGLQQLAGHSVSMPFAITATVLAAVNIVGAILLARHRPLGRLLIQLGAAGFFVKTSWAFAQTYDGGMISLAIALVLAPIEVWVIWFLAQREVAVWQTQHG
jgi:lysylphosphatidylglycerol synthetase-like protein (DUF2156 family)